MKNRGPMILISQAAKLRAAGDNLKKWNRLPAIRGPFDKVKTQPYGGDVFINGELILKLRAKFSGTSLLDP